MRALDQKNYILNGKIPKVVFSLSWPAIIAMVLYGLNPVCDAIFVGKFVGPTALAGVSFSYPLSMLAFGIGSLAGAGAGSVLSIALGAKDYKKQKRILGNMNYLVVIFTIVYSILAYVFAEKLVVMMGGFGEPLAMGTSYYRITAVMSFFYIYGISANMVIRAEGKMKLAAVMMGSGLVVNIILNYIFIVIMGYGVEGAAWGTNIGMVVYTLVGFFYFNTSKASFEAHPLKFFRDKEILSKINSLGLPNLISTVMTFLQGVVIFNVLSKHGTVFDLAFYGAAYRVFQFLLTPNFGVMRALQPAVGIHYGAENFKKIKHYFFAFFVLALIFIIPLWIGCMAFPETVLGWMFDSSTLKPSDIVNFRFLISFLPLSPVIFLSMSLFPSIGKGAPAAIIGIVRQVVFYIPVMLLLPRLFGIQWIYIGSLLIDICICIMCFVMVFAEFKKLSRLKLQIFK